MLFYFEENDNQVAGIFLKGAAGPYFDLTRLSSSHWAVRGNLKHPGPSSISAGEECSAPKLFFQQHNDLDRVRLTFGPGRAARVLSSSPSGRTLCCGCQDNVKAQTTASSFMLFSLSEYSQITENTTAIKTKEKYQKNVFPLCTPFISKIFFSSSSSLRCAEGGRLSVRYIDTWLPPCCPYIPASMQRSLSQCSWPSR